MTEDENPTNIIEEADFWSLDAGELSLGSTRTRYDIMISR
jgi:hypothetical protein